MPITRFSNLLLILAGALALSALAVAQPADNRPAPAAIFNNIPIPMSPVDKLAQVLLETNEFLYVQ